MWWKLLWCMIFKYPSLILFHRNEGVDHWYWKPWPGIVYHENCAVFTFWQFLADCSWSVKINNQCEILGQNTPTHACEILRRLNMKGAQKLVQSNFWCSLHIRYRNSVMWVCMYFARLANRSTKIRDYSQCTCSAAWTSEKLPPSRPPSPAKRKPCIAAAHALMTVGQHHDLYT